MSDRCLPILVGSWERWVDGVEGVLVQGVRHSGRVTVRRGDVNALQRDDLRRRDGIGSPIPVRRSEVLCCAHPPLLILVLASNVKGLLLQYLLYNSINMVAA